MSLSLKAKQNEATTLEKVIFTWYCSLIYREDEKPCTKLHSCPQSFTYMIYKGHKVNTVFSLSFLPLKTSSSSPFSLRVRSLPCPKIGDLRLAPLPRVFTDEAFYIRRPTSSVLCMHETYLFILKQG
jgi:hypothetical protein